MRTVTLHRLSPFLLMLAACSGSSSSGSSKPTVLPPNPAGVLLEGQPASPAIDAIASMTPSAVPAADTDAGLLLTRLEALLAQGVTVEEVNDALVANDAAIVSMLFGSPTVNLVIPAVASEAEAQAVADALVATGAFAAATPSIVESTELVPQLFADGDPVDPHVDLMRLRSAWNAKGVLGVDPEVLPVLVPDHYAALTPDPRISAQVVVPGPGIVFVPELGNRGFHAASLIGIDPGAEVGVEGSHPQPFGYVDLRSALIGGLTWSERLWVTDALLPDDGSFVLNTGWTYAADVSSRSKLWRAIDALSWRYVAAAEAPRFVHAVAAGDHGSLGTEELATAPWTSPFTLSDAYADLAALLTGDELAAFQEAVFLYGSQLTPLGNVRAVGSSISSGDPSAFSSMGEDLRVYATAVGAACVAPSATCTDGFEAVASTRAASAQVAGLYAYLWGLKPSLTRDELLVLVDLAWFQSWKPGFVDAYQAALALDPSLFASSVRQELLDVSSGLDVFDPLGDGVFDEHDLKVYVDGFEAGSNPRFDLNGDGEIGGEGTAPFDLDVNSPPIFGAVELMVEGDLHPYDETAATDLEVLCYYAYSTLYTGDVDLRTELLAACHAGAAALTKIDVFGTAETTIGTVEDEVFDEYAWVDAEPTVGDATSESGGAGGSPALSATSSASSSAVVDEEGRLVSFTYSGLLDAVADPVVPYGGQQIWVAYATAFGHLYFDVPSGTTSVTITYGVEGGSGTNPDGSADTHGGCQLTSDSGSVFSDNFSFSSSDLTWGDTRSFVLSSGSYHLHLGASSRAGATSFLGGGELIEAFATGALDLEVTFAYE